MDRRADSNKQQNKTGKSTTGQWQRQTYIKRIRGAAHCDGNFSHYGTCICSVLVSALSASLWRVCECVCVCVLFWQKTEEFHTSAHPGK
jgi:hypothetical protein